MSKLCLMCNEETNCTENCRDCAKEAYRDLKGMHKESFIGEKAIKADIGSGAFELLKRYGFIEYFATIQGHKMYAIAGGK